MAQYGMESGVNLAITLAIATILFGILVPVGIGEMTGDTTSTYNQSTSETVELHADGLNATVDSVTGGVNATYTIQYDGDSVTTTVNVGANDTVTVGGGDVKIAPTEVGTDHAVTDYTYPTTLGWGAGTTVWAVVPLFIALALMLYLLGKGMQFI